jgi:hypothetical protein
VKSIVWLASYPRSGNTWARAVLTNFLRPSGRPAPINDLLVRSAASRALFDDWVGFQASETPLGRLRGLRAELYRRLASESKEPFPLKIHDENGLCEDGGRLVPPEATHAAVYLIRNPLDVAVSFAAYSGWSIDEAIEAMSSAELTICGSPRRTTLRLPQRLGTWSAHVRGWADSSAFPVHVFRYEDLLEAPVQEFRRMIAVLRSSVDEEAVARAVERSRFEILRRQEAEEGFGERPPRASVFFRSGRAGEGRKVLTPAQVDRIRDEHGSVMSRFGYL